jgi:hypothetical protein
MKRSIENVDVEEENKDWEVENGVKRLKGVKSGIDVFLNEEKKVKEYLKEIQVKRDKEREKEEEDYFQFLVDLRMTRTATLCKNSTCMYSFFGEFQSALRRGDTEEMETILLELWRRERQEVCHLENTEPALANTGKMKVKEVPRDGEPLCKCLWRDYFGKDFAVPFTWKNAAIFFQIEPCCNHTNRETFRMVETYFLMVESFVCYFTNLKLAIDPNKCKEGLNLFFFFFSSSSFIHFFLFFFVCKKSIQVFDEKV